MPFCRDSTMNFLYFFQFSIKCAAVAAGLIILFVYYARRIVVESKDTRCRNPAVASRKLSNSTAHICDMSHKDSKQ